MKFERELENKFFDDFLQRSLFPVRASLVLAFILYALFGILDIWIVPQSEKIVWFIRFAVVCPFLVVVFFVTYTDFFKKQMQLVLSATSIIVGMGIIVMIAVANRGELGFVHYYAGLCLVIMYNYSLLRLKFPYATVSSFTLLVGYDFVAIFKQGLLEGGLSGPNLPIFLNNNFFFLSSNVIGMLTCYTLEMNSREDFVLRMDINKTYEDLKLSQEQLIRSEKAASLGQLVAGIAHEINTPIGIGVTAASHFMEITNDIVKSFDDRSARKDDMEKYFLSARQTSKLLLNNLQRTSELVKSFKMVAADQSSGEKRIFEVKSYLEGIVLNLTPMLKKTPHVVTINCPEDIKMDSYPGAFSQVVTNLLMNSLLHAYDDGDKGNIVMNISEDSGKIILNYSDDGKGIPQNVQNKIFDPFFTTNRQKGGTGLGLHIVSNILSQTLKGSISFKSAEGAGTTFTVNLPLKV